jgi:hypothetical protein
LLPSDFIANFIDALKKMASPRGFEPRSHP